MGNLELSPELREVIVLAFPSQVTERASLGRRTRSDTQGAEVGVQETRRTFDRWSRSHHKGWPEKLPPNPGHRLEQPVYNIQPKVRVEGAVVVDQIAATMRHKDHSDSVAKCVADLGR